MLHSKMKTHTGISVFECRQMVRRLALMQLPYVILRLMVAA